LLLFLEKEENYSLAVIYHNFKALRGLGCPHKDEALRVGYPERRKVGDRGTGAGGRFRKGD
jgi:hypothetical protein